MPETDQGVLMEILQRITKIETKIENLTNLDRVAADAFALANESLQSSKAAHLRLDALQAAKEIAEEANRRAAEALAQLEENEEEQKWFKRTFYGATITAVAGMLVTVIWTALKMGGIH